MNFFVLAKQSFLINEDISSFPIEMQLVHVSINMGL